MKTSYHIKRGQNKKLLFVRWEMNDIRVAMGTLLICFGLCVIGGNYIRQIRNWLNCQKGIGKRSSPTIMLGPLCCILGYAILPAAFSYLIFLVFLFDRDTLILVLRLPSLLKALCQGENVDNTEPYTSNWLRWPPACKVHFMFHHCYQTKGIKR